MGWAALPNGSSRRSVAERGFAPSFPGTAPSSYIDGMHLELTDAEAPALISLLKRAIADDRYPLSERVQTWQGILDKLEPPPARPLAAPPSRIYAPPTKGRWRPRRG